MTTCEGCQGNAVVLEELRINLAAVNRKLARLLVHLEVPPDESGDGSLMEKIRSFKTGGAAPED